METVLCVCSCRHSKSAAWVRSMYWVRKIWGCTELNKYVPPSICPELTGKKYFKIFVLLKWRISALSPFLSRQAFCALFVGPKCRHYWFYLPSRSIRPQVCIPYLRWAHTSSYALYIFTVTSQFRELAYELWHLRFSKRYSSQFSSDITTCRL